MSIFSALQRIDRLLLAQKGDVHGDFMSVGYRRMLQYWALGRYSDSAIWIRRMAECTCHYAFTVTKGVPPYGMLQEYKEALPPYLSWMTVAQVMSSVRQDTVRVDVSNALGVPLSNVTVWDVVSYCQWFGNGGAHFPCYDQVDELAFVEGIRLVLVFIGLREVLQLRSRL